MSQANKKRYMVRSRSFFTDFCILLRSSILTFLQTITLAFLFVWLRQDPRYLYKIHYCFISKVRLDSKIFEVQIQRNQFGK